MSMQADSDTSRNAPVNKSLCTDQWGPAEGILCSPGPGYSAVNGLDLEVQLGVSSGS